MSAKDKNGLGYDTQLDEMSNKSETDSEISMSVFEVRSSDEKLTSANDRFSKADGYHAIPPPITGNFLTLSADISFAGLDEHAIRKKIIESKTNTSKSKTSETVGKTNEVNIEKPKSVHESVVPKPKINRDKVIIEDWNSNNKDDMSAVKIVSPVKTNETQTVRNQVYKIGQISQKEGIRFKKIKACFVCKSSDHLIKDCDFYVKKSPEPKVQTVVNTGLLTRTGLVNPVRPNRKRAVHTVSTARSISTARPVSTARQFTPKIVQTGSAIRPIYPRMDNVRPRALYSPIKRSYYTKPAFRPKNLKQDVETSGVKNMTTARTRAVVNTSKGKMDNELKKSRLRATYGAELVSAASLVNTARPTLSTARLSLCYSKVLHYGNDVWIRKIWCCRANLMLPGKFGAVRQIWCCQANLMLPGKFSAARQKLRATYGAKLVSAASLVNTAKPTLSTARLSLCCLKVLHDGNDVWISKFDAARQIWCYHANLVLSGKFGAVRQKSLKGTIDLKILVPPSRHSLFSDKNSSLFISMANLEFVDQHNMVACLEKTEGNSDFHEIVDFLASSLIHHALTHGVFGDQDADHGMEYMETKEAVDEGRQSGETKEVKLTNDTKVVEDNGSGDKGGNAEELVSTARAEVSTARPDIDAARQEDSAVEPRTPPTTTSVFDDEDITMAQTLIKMKEEKAKEKGVSIKDVDDSSRPGRSILTLKPLPTIDPKDKGKGVLKESPVKKVKRSDMDAAHIAKDAEIARLVHEKELAKMEREREERQRQDQAYVDYIVSLYDEVQANMDASEELAARLQMEERERERCKYRHNQLNKKTFEEIQALYIKEQERDADFVPIGSKRDEKMIDKMNKKALSTLGDLMIMFNPTDEDEFWNSQQDWNVVKVSFEKESVVTDVELKLESEEDGTMALELIRFVKKLIAELEPENFDGDGEESLSDGFKTTQQMSSFTSPNRNQTQNWLVRSKNAFGKDFHISNPYIHS
ncbi:hypothetical protein Tco_0564537 [Tanacetum coccineum]